MPPFLHNVASGLKLFVPYVAYISALLSLVALYVVLLDRRPNLSLQAKKGQWIVVSKATPGGWLVEGIIEAYNVSSRANTIREYLLSVKGDDGNWVPLECEQYTLVTTSDRDEAPPRTETTRNETPLVLPPYSGIIVPIAAVTGQMKRPELVRVEVMDLFGKRYSLEVPSSSDISRRGSFRSR
jgi:hypothetical protein